MVGSIVSAGLGSALQLGSMIGGLVSSKKANDKAQTELDSRKRENEQWYKQKMDEDYMMRSDVQNTLRKQRELLDQQYKRARATNMVAGGTDESLVLQQQAANDAMGETMADIAANASASKDNAEAQYRAAKSDLSTQQQNIYANRAAAVSQAASQAVNAGSGLLSAGLEGITTAGKLKQDVK